MSETLVQIVDEHDLPLRGATMEEVWREGLICRVARIMVETADGQRILLQRRANKKLYPNRWDNSVSGKVELGEGYEATAKREGKEEINLSPEVELTEVDHYQSDAKWQGRPLREYNKVFRALVDPETSFHPREGEVAEVRWFARAELLELVTQNPDQCTHGLLDVVNHLYRETPDGPRTA